MHSVVAPKAFNSTSIKGQIHWLLITVVGYIIFAWVVVANLIPFFGELHGLMGALLGCPIVFGWPSLDSLLASKKNAGSRADTFSSIGFVNSSLLCLIDLSVYYLFYSLLVLYSMNMGWYCGHHPRYYQLWVFLPLLHHDEYLTSFQQYIFFTYLFKFLFLKYT